MNGLVYIGVDSYIDMYVRKFYKLNDRPLLPVTGIFVLKRREGKRPMKFTAALNVKNYPLLFFNINFSAYLVVFLVVYKTRPAVSADFNV